MSNSRRSILTLAGTVVALSMVSLKLFAESKPDTTQVGLTTSAPMEVLTSSGCLGCHQISSKLVGPAFTAVAEKYAGRDDAVDYLSGKIRQGGSGVWGGGVMPPMAHVSEDKADEIARWLAQ